MIQPYAAQQLNPLYVADTNERNSLLEEAKGLPQLVTSSAAAANAVMLASGYFSPLTGYMNLKETLSVAKEMKLPDGLMWPVPVINLLPKSAVPSEVKPGTRVALKDPNVEGNPVYAVMDVAAVESISDSDRQEILNQVYRTTETAHPGVAAFVEAGDTLLSGPIKVVSYSYFADEFPDTFRTAVQIREAIGEMSWQKVVAFQTRNPMHRAHEELCRMAKEAVGADGVLIHMLLGRLKKGDIPADIRDNAIRTLVEKYFPPRTVLITGYGFDMLYAGPREAVLHAIFRQNAGCTHFIVGRDHAGVGSYYGPFDAQAIFDELPPNELKIEIFKADHTAWSKKLGKVVMMRDYPDHQKEDYLMLSGTKVRELLAQGEPLPEEFTRPEVAEILRGHYK